MDLPLLPAWHGCALTVADGPGNVAFDAQEQYNALYEGATFDIETRYAIMLNTLFVTMMFSAGLPVLIAFAAFNFLLTFVVDKFMLLRYYAVPPSYDATIALMISQFLPWALVVHLANSCWMLSTESLMSSGKAR